MDAGGSAPRRLARLNKVPSPAAPLRAPLAASALVDELHAHLRAPEPALRTVGLLGAAFLVPARRSLRLPLPSNGCLLAGDGVWAARWAGGGPSPPLPLTRAAVPPPLPPAAAAARPPALLTVPLHCCPACRATYSDCSSSMTGVVTKGRPAPVKTGKPGGGGGSGGGGSRTPRSARGAVAGLGSPFSDASPGAEDNGGPEPLLSDEEMAWRLHQELNARSPVLRTRSRKTLAEPGGSGEHELAAVKVEEEPDAKEALPAAKPAAKGKGGKPKAAKVGAAKGAEPAAGEAALPGDAAAAAAPAAALDDDAAAAAIAAAAVAAALKAEQEEQAAAAQAAPAAEAEAAAPPAAEPAAQPAAVPTKPSKPAGGKHAAKKAAAGDSKAAATGKAIGGGKAAAGGKPAAGGGKAAAGAKAAAGGKSGAGKAAAKPKPLKIPRLPMVRHASKWYRCRVLKDEAERAFMGECRQGGCVKDRQRQGPAQQ